MENIKVEDDSASFHVSFDDEVRKEVSDSSNLSELSKHLALIEEKLKFYQIECNRYCTQRVEIIENAIQDENCAINLDDYMIGTLGCKIMFETLVKYPITDVKILSLANNHLQPSCCDAIANFIECSSSLCDLNLAGCKIGDEGIQLLVHAFAISPSITRLNLSNNNITDDGGEILIQFLMRNESCAELNLSCNALSLKTSNALGEVLLVNESLKRLDLCHNRLYEQFAIVKLLDGLMRNKSLEYLDISWNGLCGEPLGKIFSRSVKGANLKVLKIENNALESFELQKLALGMKYSKTIKEVYVGGNFFTSEDDENIVKVFTTKSPLELLSFGAFYHLSHEAFEALKEAKALKPSIRVIYQNVIRPNPPREVLMLDICADRAKFLAMKPTQRRLKRDMGVFMTKLRNHPTPYMLRAEFLEALKEFNPILILLDKELINTYIEECVVTVEGAKRLDVHLMANLYFEREVRKAKELNKI